MSKICINASNIHVGGALQVACSFLYEIYHSDLRNEINLVVSSEVDEYLCNFCDVNEFSSYCVKNTYGMSIFNLSLAKILNSYEVVFTIFGPLYTIGIKSKKVVGFAQAWIAYPKNEVFKRIGVLKKIALKIKFFLQKNFFLFNSDLIVVEAKHLVSALEKLGFDKKKIFVVNNCVSRQYENFLAFDRRERSDNFSIGLLSRDYVHKNLDFIAEVSYILKCKMDLDVDFYVTLSKKVCEGKSDFFKKWVHNYGEVKVQDGPLFYQRIDAVIFPSLLESFSVTPLEALACGKPLFASDRDFVKDVCLDYAYYFDPLDPKSAAEKIKEFLQSNSDEIFIFNAKRHALNFSNARKRMEDYIGILKGVLYVQKK